MYRVTWFLSATTFALLLGFQGSGPGSVTRNDRVDWDAVVGPAAGKWGAPQESVFWRDDLRRALAEAQRFGRPVFVTLRCLPCKQCATFDKDVLEGGADITPLLAHFVTVRLTDASEVDANLLPVAGFQDTDLSWWGYFLSPQGRVYGIFGGRDEVSDSTRISTKALANTLRRVLDHHHDPRRKDWKIDGPAPTLASKPRTPSKWPGYKKWFRYSPDASRQSCLHCHQLGDILRQPAIESGTFDKAKGTAIWPLPENVGLHLDRDDGLLVTKVVEGSASAAAGLRVGDRLAVANRRRLFGQADFRGVLHRSANPKGTIAVQWLRDGKRMQGTLRLAEGWRKTVLDWRMSISQGIIGADLGFFPLSRHYHPPGGGKQRQAIQPFFGRNRKSPAFRAGLRPHHLIIDLDGKPVESAGRPFLVRFRIAYDAGDEVRFGVIDQGKRREIKVRLAQAR